MEHIIPAEFHGTSLSIIDRDGQKWLTAEEVGRCLGYNDANVRKGINKLYNAHADEFTDADTCVVDLATQVQSRAIRIFSSTGCIKLGFFANSPRAKDFRTWASRVLAGQMASPPPAPALPDLSLAREIGALKDTVAAQNQAIVALYQRIDTAQRGQIRAVTSLLNLQKRQAAREAKEMVLLLEAQGVPRETIAARTGKTFNHIRQIIYQAKQRELNFGEAA